MWCGYNVTISMHENNLRKLGTYNFQATERNHKIACLERQVMLLWGEIVGWSWQSLGFSGHENVLVPGFLI